MGKNILMTTLSTLNRMDIVHYYFSTGTEGGSPLFCDGISTVENGSKYILSQYPVDEILVVGSSETFSKEDSVNIENLLDDNLWDDLYREWTEDYQRGRGKKNGEKISAFEFYKMRIVEFIHQKDVISRETVFKSVSEQKRRERIEEITLNVLRDMAGEERVGTEELGGCIVRWLMSQEKSKSLVGKLRGEITDDIERSFQEEEGYLRYIQQGQELISRYIEVKVKSQEYHKMREGIEKDTSLSILEREFLFVSLLRKMDALYFEKEKINMEAEVEALRGENASLQYQIQNLKNQRLEKELAFAQYVIYQYLDNRYKMGPKVQKRISMRFIPEKVIGENKKQFDNIAEIVNEIYRVQDGGDGSINVYVDMQGGSRTSGYVRNAVLSILNNQETNDIQIQEIIATDFNPQNPYVSEIVDETKRYRIHDLVSGMNAFIRYGKADMLKEYCRAMGEKEDSRVGRLVQAMKGVDDAIALCNPQELGDGIRNLSEILNTESDIKERSYVSNVFQVLEDGIRRDYGSLLPEIRMDDKSEVDYLELVAWCHRKGLIQQALTILEDKMPKVIMERLVSIHVRRKGDTGLCDMEMRELSRALEASSWETRKENILFYGVTRKIQHSREAEEANRNFCYAASEKICRVYLSKMCRCLNEDEMTERILNNFFYNKDNIFKITGVVGRYDETVHRMTDRDYNRRKLALWSRFIEIYRKHNGIHTPLNLHKRIDGNEVDEDRVRRQEKILLNKCEKGEKIAEDYCLFREMSFVYTLRRKQLKNLFLDVDIYNTLALSDEEYWMQIVDGTALRTLAGLKEKEYEFKYRDENSELKTMVLKAELSYPLKRLELEKLLLLHEALKKERNNSNHASERGIRLPVKIVGKAIQEYIKIFQSIEQSSVEE